MMKYFFLHILIFHAALSGAQINTDSKLARPDAEGGFGNRIQRGTLLTSGNFHFRGYSSDLTNYSVFTVGVTALVGMSPRYAIGLTTGYMYEKSEFQSGTLTANTRFNQFSIGPSFRALGRMNWGWLQPFGQVDMPLSFGKSRSVQGKTELSSYGIRLRPGLTAFLSRRLAVETSLGIIEYVENRSSNGPFDSQTSNLNVGLGLEDLQFGLVFLFNSY